MAIGIYKILNKVDGSLYIGSSNHIVKRFNTHKTKLNANTHPNIHLQRAWNKYGKRSFAFAVVEYCPEPELTEREQYYIDLVNPRYNICPLASSSRGRPISQETRDKLSKAHLGHSRNKGRIAKLDEIISRVSTTKGKTRSEETKRIIGEKTSKYTRTEEHNELLSLNSTNKRSVVKIDPVSKKVIQEYDSILAVVKDMKLSTHAHIQKCCAGVREKAHGFKWAYLGEKRKVVAVNVNGNIIDEFNSFSAVSKRFKKSRTYIKKCFNENKADYDGIKYRYAV